MYKRQEEEKRRVAEGLSEPLVLEDVTLDICKCVGVEFPLMDEKTKVYRVGKEQDDGKTRPVRIEFPDAELARLFLSNAPKLKKCDIYSNVYVAPDRTKEQRLEHSKLVRKMKEMITADSTKHYYIKNGHICTADKRKDVILSSE